MLRNVMWFFLDRIGIIGRVGLLILSAMLLQPPAGSAAWDPQQKLPVSVQLLLREVREQMNQKDYRGAIDTIIAFDADEDSASIGSGRSAPCRHPLVCFALGNCYLLMDDCQNAQNAFAQALETAPEFADAWVNLAKASYECKQFGPAARSFLHAYAASDPSQPEYLYFSAVADLMAGKSDQAIHAFKRLFRDHPKEIELQWRENYANALMAAGRVQEALPVVLELASRTQGDSRLQWQEVLLQVYLQLGKTQEALTFVVERTREDCILARWWKARTQIHLSLGHYEDALADLTIYGFLAQLTADEQKIWADLSLQLGIPARAVPVYETLLQRTADRQLIERLLPYLVSAYRQMGMPEKALAQVDRFYPQVNDPEMMMLKGDVLYSMKRFTEAEKAYRLAAKKDFQRAGQAWLLAGYAAWQTNDVNGSREAFQHAARYSRHRKDALSAMAQLERTN